MTDFEIKLGLNFLLPLFIGAMTLIIFSLIINFISIITEIGFFETILALLLVFILIGAIWVLGYTVILFLSWLMKVTNKE